MRSTQELVREHGVIESVLRALDLKLNEADRTGAVPVDFLRDVVRFSQSFVDRCHHGKEERCLFPCLEKRGIPKDGGPIGVMLQEHEMGRRLVQQIAERLDLYERGGADAGEVFEVCRMYVDLLRGHILKENHLLFPMGEQVMADQDDKRVQRCYEGGTRAMDRGEHERLLDFARALSADA